MFSSKHRTCEQYRAIAKVTSNEKGKHGNQMNLCSFAVECWSSALLWLFIWPAPVNLHQIQQTLERDPSGRCLELIRYWSDFRIYIKSFNSHFYACFHTFTCKYVTYLLLSVLKGPGEQLSPGSVRATAFSWSLQTKQLNPSASNSPAQE